MTEAGFNLAIKRLSEQFKGAYSTERCKVLWPVIRHMPDEWLDRTTDKFLGECRQAPLVPEFRDEMRAAQSALISPKRQQTDPPPGQLDESWESEVPLEDRRIMFNAIRAKMNNAISDGAWYSIFPKLQTGGQGGK